MRVVGAGTVRHGPMMVAVEAVAMMGDIDGMYILWSHEFS